jgi:vitamin B12 transporter
MLFHRNLAVFFISTAVLCLAQPTRAQQNISGVVKDPSGKPIAAALLRLYPESGSGMAPIAVSRSGGDGLFSFAAGDRTSGKFLIEVAADGFVATTVPVTTGTPTVVKLKIEGIAQRIIVTAEGAPQSIDQISKAASVITAEEIAQRNEYSLTEALRDTPGILIRNLGGPGQSTSIRMRGLRADATAVLIDGLRFRDVATTQADSSSFTSTLNIIHPERVEVLRGSGSSLYGTNAVGGTINVVSDSGGGKTRGSLLTEGGSLGLMRGKATVSGGLKGDRFAYSAGLLHLNVLSGVDGDDRARSSGAQTFVRYTFDPQTSLSGRWMFSDDFVQPNLSPTATGIPAANIPSGAIVKAIPLAIDQVRNSTRGLPIVAGNATFIPNRNDPDNRRASRFWSGASILRRQFTPKIGAQADFQRVHTNRIFQNGPAGPGTQPRVSNISQFTGDIDTAGGRTNIAVLPNLTLTAGYEFEAERYLNLDDNRLPAPGTVSTRTQAGQQSHAAYFATQSAWFGQRLQVSLSGRGQWFSLDRPQFRYTGTANNYASLTLAAPPRALTGDSAISYFHTRTGTKLRAHAGNSYRAPGLYERFGSGFFYNSATNSVAFSPYGDPRLAPDRYNSVDAGVDQYLLRDRVRVGATWFYTRIVQITQFDSSGSAVNAVRDPFGRSSGYFNGAGGTSRGVEFSVEAQPWRSTLLRSSYWYTNAATDQDTAVRGFFRALSVPAHAWTAFWRQRIVRRTDLTFDLYHSSSYYNSLSAAGRARAYLYSGVTKADAVVSRTIRETDRYSLNWYGKVDNILNRRYFENGFQAPRATFLTGLNVQFR